MTTRSTDEYIAEARSLAKKVAERSNEIDRDRQIPADLGAEMADAGFFRLLVPKSLGGAELDHPDFLRIVTTFAEVDASVAWCVNQNNIFATDSARMLPEIAETIWSDQRAVVTNGPPAPETQAVPVDGGYRLSGHWDFSSGANLSTWLAARAPVVNSNGSGRPQAIMLLFPKSEAKMLDLWQVNGLRGTASFSFEVDNLFVPEGNIYRESDSPRVKGAQYAIPKVPLFAIGFATIALTQARLCLDEAIALASHKEPRETGALLRDQRTIQRTVGETEAILRSAQSYLNERAAEAWRTTCETGSFSMEERMQVRMATTHALRQAARVVDTAYDMFGANAIFTSQPIQRRYQDVKVITQHIQSRLSNFETAGQFFLGLEPKGMF